MFFMHKFFQPLSFYCIWLCKTHLYQASQTLTGLKGSKTFSIFVYLYWQVKIYKRAPHRTALRDRKHTREAPPRGKLKRHSDRYSHIDCANFFLLTDEKSTINVRHTSSASSTKATTWALIKFFLDCITLSDDGPFSRPVLCNQPAVSTWITKPKTLCNKYNNKLI